MSGAVKDKEIDQRIKDQSQAFFNAGPKELDRRFFPGRSNDVPNRPVLTLVVLGLDNTVSDAATHKLMESIVRECGTSGRTYKSALIFAAPDSAENIREAARSLLAWEAIDEDEETKSRLDDTNKRLLARSKGRAESDMAEAIWRSYRNLFLLGADNKLRQIDLGQITSSMAGSLVELILNELGRTDEITKGIGANKLIKYWPPALTEWSTKSVRDAFYSSPQLPRLLDPDAVKRTICDGVSQGMLGYASKDGKGRLKLERFKDSLGESEVDISDEAFIVKAEDAQKLLEPPRLAQLVVQPLQVQLKPGERAGFSAAGRDQYGQSFPVIDVRWSTKGGQIEPDGSYTAGELEGLFTVHALSGGIETIGEIRVAKQNTPLPTPDKQIIRWSGDVPPQKWMNFYTKVLSRFASSKDLKLSVTFEVPADGEQGTTKANEAKTGLKELGLDDDVRLS